MKKLLLSLLAASLFLLIAFAGWRKIIGWDAGMHHPRSEIHAAVLNDRVYVAGGIGLFRVLDSCENYHIATRKWERCAPLPRPLHHVAMAADGKRIYASGGYIALPFRQDQDAALFAYDPAADRWDEIAKLPHPIGQHAMVRHDGKLYLIGGQNGAEDLATLWAYDISTGEWSELAAMPTARHSHAIALAGSKLYVTGGRSAELGTEIDRVEVYDLVQNRWESLPAMPRGRAGHGAFVRSGRLHVFGGETLSKGMLIEEHDVLDLASGRWSKGNPLPHARHGFAVGDDQASDHIYVIGGGARPGFHTIYSVTGTLQDMNAAH